MLAWQYFSAHSRGVRLLVSSPEAVLTYFRDNGPDLALATWTTFAEASSGLIIATVFAFAAMTLCFFKPRLMEFLMPLMVAGSFPV